MISTSLVSFSVNTVFILESQKDSFCNEYFYSTKAPSYDRQSHTEGGETSESSDIGGRFQLKHYMIISVTINNDMKVLIVALFMRKITTDP